MWQLHQREGIAARFDDQPLEHLVVQRSRQDRLEERAGVAMTERFDMDLGQPPERLAHLPRGEHDRDPLGREAASREPEAWADARSSHWASSITQRRPRSSCRLRQQSENRERHEERVRSRARAEPEGDIERVALRTRQSLTECKDRRAELLNRSERELHLALDPGGADDSQRRGLLDRVVEQRRLADAGLAMDDERAAVSVAGGLHQPVKGRSLALPAQQLHPP